MRRQRDKGPPGGAGPKTKPAVLVSTAGMDQ